MITGQLCPSTCFGHLTIGGVDMHTPAWTMLDLTPLWFAPDHRGENVTIPGAAGRRAYPLRVDQTDYSLPMMLSGAVDQFGVPFSQGEMYGLWYNAKWLNDQVVYGSAATRPAVLGIPNGPTLNAAVQVLAVRLGTGTAEMRRATLELRIPAGRFV